MDPDPPLLPVKLWKADAIVLHQWLTTVDLDSLPFEHPGQRQALSDLLTELDQTAAADATDAEIVRAHELVDRTGTAIDPARVRLRHAAAASAASAAAGDPYGLEPL